MQHVRPRRANKGCLWSREYFQCQRWNTPRHRRASGRDKSDFKSGWSARNNRHWFSFWNPKHFPWRTFESARIQQDAGWRIWGQYKSRRGCEAARYTRGCCHRVRAWWVSSTELWSKRLGPGGHDPSRCSWLTSPATCIRARYNAN